MNPTKIKRKDLKRGDMFCEITAMADRPVMIAFKDGDDLVFDRSVFERDVHRFSWKDANIELSKDINLLTERVDANTLHTMTCGDAIADLRAQVKELTEENDILRDAVNKEGSLADNVVRDVEELHARLNECRHAKQTLQVIVAERGDQTRAVEIIASKSAKIEMLSTKLAECHDAFVGRGDDSPITIMRRHIAELEELHDIDAQAWSKRESDLLQMVEDRDDSIGRQRTSIQGLILSRGEKDELIGEMQFDLDRSIKSNELLNVMLKIVNPIIKSGEYAHPAESSRFLSMEMYQVCRDVIAYRRAHNM